MSKETDSIRIEILKELSQKPQTATDISYKINQCTATAIYLLKTLKKSSLVENTGSHHSESATWKVTFRGTNQVRDQNGRLIPPRSARVRSLISRKWAA